MPKLGTFEYRLAIGPMEIPMFYEESQCFMHKEGKHCHWWCVGLRVAELLVVSLVLLAVWVTAN